MLQKVIFQKKCNQKVTASKVVWAKTLIPNENRRPFSQNLPKFTKIHGYAKTEDIRILRE